MLADVSILMSLGFLGAAWKLSPSLIRWEPIGCELAFGNLPGGEGNGNIRLTEVE